MKKVLILHNIGEELKRVAEEKLRKRAKVIYKPQLDTNIIVLGWGVDFDEDLLLKMKNLEFLHAVPAGVNKVPFEKLSENVVVASGSGSNSVEVAEHAFALILALAKNLKVHEENIKKGILKQDVQGRLLFKKNLGILGFGSIGVEVARIAKGFGMKVFGINRKGFSDFKIDFLGKEEDLEYVLKNSDFIVCTLPLTKKTKNYITKRELEMMKKDAVFVNVSRGVIVNERDIYEHLKRNPEFLFATDVLWDYKNIKQHYPFLELKNSFMTPHIAAIVEGTQKNMFLFAIENVLRYLRGETPKNIVNPADYL